MKSLILRSLERSTYVTSYGNHLKTLSSLQNHQYLTHHMPTTRHVPEHLLRFQSLPQNGDIVNDLFKPKFRNFEDLAFISELSKFPRSNFLNFRQILENSSLKQNIIDILLLLKIFLIPFHSILLLLLFFSSVVVRTIIWFSILFYEEQYFEFIC